MYIIGKGGHMGKTYTNTHSRAPSTLFKSKIKTSIVFFSIYVDCFSNSYYIVKT